MGNIVRACRSGLMGSSQRVVSKAQRFQVAGLFARTGLSRLPVAANAHPTAAVFVGTNVSHSAAAMPHPSRVRSSQVSSTPIAAQVSQFSSQQHWVKGDVHGWSEFGATTQPTGYAFGHRRWS